MLYWEIFLVLVIVNHYLAFHFFGEHYYPFSEVSNLHSGKYWQFLAKNFCPLWYTCFLLGYGLLHHVPLVSPFCILRVSIGQRKCFAHDVRAKTITTRYVFKTVDTWVMTFSIALQMKTMWSATISCAKKNAMDSCQYSLVSGNPYCQPEVKKLSKRLWNICRSLKN